MENLNNTANKQKATETSSSAQALQVVTGIPSTPTVAGSTPATLSQATPLPRVAGLATNPPQLSISSDTSTEEISPALLGNIQQIVSATIREQVAALAPARMAMPSDVDAPEEEAEEVVPVPVPPTDRRQEAPPQVPQEVPPQWSPEDERKGIPFTEVVMVDELPVNCRNPAITEYDGTTDPLEHLACFENAALLHRYTDGIKCRVLVTTFARAAQQWFNQLPVGAIGSFQEFRSLFLHQFASSRRLWNTELSLFAVRQKDNEPLKKYLQRFNTAALEALMVVEGKWLLARPRSWKEGPQRPQSDKFYCFHNDYGRTTEECCHLKNEIERLIQNGYLQEYVCWEKARGTGPYQKKEIEKPKETKAIYPEASAKRGPKMGTGDRTDDPPRKGVIRMIAGGPIGGDSHHARKRRSEEYMTKP
ncbi:UNVERIFIED_CONTAM: hypothetical protein Slati_1283500 [Sesamum latifolium]|uniref:Retrotransposon gag domain-containing protein n=1 Tax=Sesamum latifolium TaxID=2727402 RepID=A0AAW2XGQ3_9LAMI